ncbi:ATP-binding protein [uncultured Veillonella sp.]|uniref:ATP-binding protein n=1 Tax=uncultured Veillonella sp. TaxID=159268 RepID=UPI0025929E91|nr:ATP-binding protein [uncultured Veillonella sp.]
MKIEPMQHILTTAGAMGTGTMPDDKGMADIFANAKKRIEEALAREHVVLDEAVAKNDNYFLRLLEFAESNEHCTFHCPGRTHCDSAIKGYTARMDAHGYISYCKCKAGDTYWDIFSTSQTKASHIPALYRQMTLANYKETEDNKKALCYAKELLAQGTAGKGLFLTGTTGTGKTHLAVATLQAWIEKGHSGAFCTVPLLVDQLRECMDGNDGKSVYMDRLARVDLLVLDDFGAEYSTDWVRSQMWLIINARYAEHKPFIITSNLRLEDIEAGGGVQGQRICSRIAGHCHVLELGGADRRVTPLF